MDGEQDGRFVKGGDHLINPWDKGEVKVFPTTDDPQRFKKLDRVLLDNGKEKEN